MVRCSEGPLYIGIAFNVTDRVRRHNWGVGPKFTAQRRPVELIWSECCGTAVEARQREREIKGWSREKKLKLVEEVKMAQLRVDPSLAPSAPAQGKGE
jgi:putative endonuclease